MTETIINTADELHEHIAHAMLTGLPLITRLKYDADENRIIRSIISHPEFSTNQTEKPAAPDEYALKTALAALGGVKQDIPHSLNAGKDVMVLLRRIRVEPGAPSTGLLGSFSGIQVFSDDNLAPNEWEIRSRDGKVLARSEK